MRVTNRVTNTAMNRKYTTGVNDVHGRLNKAMNRVSSGKAYENAAENPLAYYQGKKLDNQYQDVESKMELISDLEKRLEEQEGGAYAIQNQLAEAQKKVVYITSDSNNGEHTVATVREDFVQRAQFMVNELNSQYRDYYIFGGCDVTSTPFELSIETNQSVTLTYNHTFPGTTTVETMKLTWTLNGDKLEMNEGTAGDLDKIINAMQEQGRVDIGYGLISDRNTLMDTYTGGMNVLAGLSSDAVVAGMKGANPADMKQKVFDQLKESPIGLLAEGILRCDDRMNGGDAGTFSNGMNALIDTMSDTHTRIGIVYSDLGNKYSLLEDMESKLKKQHQSLEAQYKDKLGADPYEAIMDMFSEQYSYSACLQLGSKMMQSSLFDFIR